MVPNVSVKSTRVSLLEPRGISRLQAVNTGSWTPHGVGLPCEGARGEPGPRFSLCVKKPSRFPFKWAESTPACPGGYSNSVLGCEAESWQLTVILRLTSNRSSDSCYSAMGVHLLRTSRGERIMNLGWETGCSCERQGKDSLAGVGAGGRLGAQN